MVLPSIEVSHLAPSSSFFAAVLQPLGITFVDAPAASSAIIFGADGHPVLQLRQAPSARCRLSSLVFAAPTRLAVASFLESALKANPDQSLPKEKASTTEDGVARATVVDLDGNTMEAVYPDPRPHSAVRYSGTAVRKTQSTTSEVGRILEWNYNVASSDASPSATRPRPGPSSTSPSLAIQRSPLRQPASAAPPSKTDAATHGSSLINTSTVVGALLGVAAGAALTYGIVSRDKDRNTHHDTEVPRTLPRRATFPDRPALMEASKASSYPGVPKVAPRKALPYPEKGSLQVHGVEPRQPRPHEHDIASFGKHPTRGSPELAAPRSVAAARSTGSNRAGTFVDGKSSAARQPGGEFDTRSRLSSRNGHGRAPSTRSRSEAPSRRASVVGAERDRLSYARPPSHQTDAPRETQSCQRVACEPDQSSYISAQSRRTEHSYSRAPSASRGSRSEHGSLHRGSYLSARHIQLPASQAPTYLSGRDVPLPESQAASFASAREVPLPESNLGSNSVNWNDDLVSIAPSDSISCVGTRASQRSRRFQRR